MNPVTASFLKQLDWPELEQWIDQWDEFEQILLSAYRSGEVSEDQRKRYHALRNALRSSYPTWQSGLRTYWSSTRVQGELLGHDPFLTLTSHPELQVERVEWSDMKMLPAAREALNCLLLDAVNRQKEAK